MYENSNKISMYSLSNLHQPVLLSIFIPFKVHRTVERDEIPFWLQHSIPKYIILSREVNSHCFQI